MTDPMIINVNANLGVSTAPEVEWLDPYVRTPPLGSGISLLTWGNIQTVGIWGTNGHLDYAAWAPRISRPDWLKERMSAQYIGDFKPTPVGR